MATPRESAILKSIVLQIINNPGITDRPLRERVASALAIKINSLDEFNEYYAAVEVLLYSNKIKRITFKHENQMPVDVYFSREWEIAT